MHYKNGREAKNGDKIVLTQQAWSGNTGTVGILYDATPGNDACNGRIAAISPNDPCPNLAECLHIDDAMAVLTKDVPDTSVPATVDSEPPPTE